MRHASLPQRPNRKPNPNHEATTMSNNNSQQGNGAPSPPMLRALIAHRRVNPETKEERTFWTRVGTAFVAKNGRPGSYTLYITPGLSVTGQIVLVPSDRGDVADAAAPDDVVAAEKAIVAPDGTYIPGFRYSPHSDTSHLV